MTADDTSLLDLAADDPAALTALYEQHGWGDGLPMVPPTPERVTEMLAGTDPDEVIAVLPPRSGIATRRVIAVNAVLAGCEPRHLRVLVATVRALAAPELNLVGVNATTHCVAPLLIVHGEVANTGGYNSGLGAFGPGNRANATTGRAVRLILMHVCGARPGPGDASTQGGRRSTRIVSPKTHPSLRGVGTPPASESKPRPRSRCIAARPRTTYTTWSPRTPRRFSTKSLRR